MKTHCPQPETLVEYLKGRLPQYETDSCEAHLAKCEPCVETIRGLKVRDTLTDLARKAWPQPNETKQSSDSQFVDGLISQMREIGRPQDSQADGQRRPIVEDRAAEVQSLLPDSNVESDLGKVAHYRIVELLGAGSTGVVYQAFDEQLKRHVAIKILRPSLGEAARERFIAEAQATAAIDHVHVITIYHVGEEGPLAYIAMQLQPGETLDERLVRETILSIEETKSLGRQIAAGLHAAHQNGLIHRDIKPANIWLDTQQNEARILDFGLVRVTDEDPQQTCTGMVAGTPCFMSPEQSRGARLDARSDLFSLGCLLYQSLTGRLPFQSENALATLQCVQRDQPSPPNELDPNVPDDLSDLVMCLLEKSPAKRPQSADAVCGALQSERDHWTFPVEVYSLASKTGPTTIRSTSWLRHLFALAVSLLLILGGFMYGPQIIRIINNQGELVIESEVSDVQVELLQNEERVRIIDLTTEQTVEIVSGEYQIRPLDNGNSIVLDRNKLTLKRGGKAIVQVTANHTAEDAKVKKITNEAKENEYSPASIGKAWSIEIDEIQQTAIETGRYQEGIQKLDGVRYRARSAPLQVANHDSLNDKIARYQLELIERKRLATNGSEKAKNENVRALPLDSSKLELVEPTKSATTENFSQKPTPVDEPTEYLKAIDRSASAYREAVEGLAYHEIKNSAKASAARIDLNDARIALRNFEFEHGLAPTLPVYDGRGFESLLQIVEQERDMKKLVPSIRGVAILAEDFERPEMIGAVLRVFRRGSGLAEHDFENEYYQLRSKFLSGLSGKELSDVYAHEIESGTQHSQSMLSIAWRDPASRDIIQRKLLPHRDKIVAALISHLNDDSFARSVFAGNFIPGFIKAMNIDAQENPQLVEAIERFIPTCKTEDERLSLIQSIIHHSKNADELIVKACQILTNEETTTNLAGARHTLCEILEKVPRHQRLLAIPAIKDYMDRNHLERNHADSIKLLAKFIMSFEDEIRKEFKTKFQSYSEAIEAQRDKQNGKINPYMYSVSQYLKSAAENIATSK